MSAALTPAQLASIYRESARRIAEREPCPSGLGICKHSCTVSDQVAVERGFASRRISGNAFTDVSHAYAWLMSDDVVLETARATAWQFDCEADAENLRVLALCFVAAMAEAGDV